MGVTDIDDKIIARAKSDGLSGVSGAAKVSRTHEKMFLKDMKVCMHPRMREVSKESDGTCMHPRMRR